MREQVQREDDQGGLACLLLQRYRSLDKIIIIIRFPLKNRFTSWQSEVIQDFRRHLMLH